MENEGTHNRLAAPVLMLRPAGPLADLAKAIVDRGAGSLPRICTQYAFAFLSLCLPACPPASSPVWQYMDDKAELCDVTRFDAMRCDAIRCDAVAFTAIPLVSSSC